MSAAALDPAMVGRCHHPHCNCPVFIPDGAPGASIASTDRCLQCNHHAGFHLGRQEPPPPRPATEASTDSASGPPKPPYSTSEASPESTSFTPFTPGSSSGASSTRRQTRSSFRDAAAARARAAGWRDNAGLGTGGSRSASFGGVGGPQTTAFTRPSASTGPTMTKGTFSPAARAYQDADIDYLKTAERKRKRNKKKGKEKDVPAVPSGPKPRSTMFTFVNIASVRRAQAGVVERPNNLELANLYGHGHSRRVQISDDLTAADCLARVLSAFASREDGAGDGSSDVDLHPLMVKHGIQLLRVDRPVAPGEDPLSDSAKRRKSGKRLVLRPHSESFLPRNIRFASQNSSVPGSGAMIRNPIYICLRGRDAPTLPPVKPEDDIVATNSTDSGADSSDDDNSAEGNTPKAQSDVSEGEGDVSDNERPTKRSRTASPRSRGNESFAPAQPSEAVPDANSPEEKPNAEPVREEVPATPDVPMSEPAAFDLDDDLLASLEDNTASQMMRNLKLLTRNMRKNLVESGLDHQLYAEYTEVPFLWHREDLGLAVLELDDIEEVLKEGPITASIASQAMNLIRERILGRTTFLRNAVRHIQSENGAFPSSAQLDFFHSGFKVGPGALEIFYPALDIALEVITLLKTACVEDRARAGLIIDVSRLYALSLDLEILLGALLRGVKFIREHYPRKYWDLNEAQTLLAYLDHFENRMKFGSEEVWDTPAFNKLLQRLSNDEEIRIDILKTAFSSAFSAYPDRPRRWAHSVAISAGSGGVRWLVDKVLVPLTDRYDHENLGEILEFVEKVYKGLWRKIRNHFRNPHRTERPAGPPSGPAHFHSRSDAMASDEHNFRTGERRPAIISVSKWQENWTDSEDAMTSDASLPDDAHVPADYHGSQDIFERKVSRGRTEYGRARRRQPTPSPPPQPHVPSPSASPRRNRRRPHAKPHRSPPISIHDSDDEGDKRSVRVRMLDAELSRVINCGGYTKEAKLRTLARRLLGAPLAGKEDLRRPGLSLSQVESLGHRALYLQLMRIYHTDKLPQERDWLELGTLVSQFITTLRP